MQTESERLMRDKAEEHRQKQADLKADRRDALRSLKDQQLETDDQLHRLRMIFDSSYTEQLNQGERQMKELQLKYEKKLKQLRDDMEAKRKADVEEMEQRKADHIRGLMAEHDKAFRDIKDYYADITTNDLELIKNLKEQVSEMKRSEAYNEKLMFDIAQENKRLTDPLAAALREVNILSHRLANHERDKHALRAAKHNLSVLEQQKKHLTWEHEVLTQRMAHLQAEYDRLYLRYQEALQEVQQKTAFSSVLLHKKMEILQNAAEKKTAQLSELLKGTNVPADALGPIHASLDSLFAAKDEAIQTLQKELSLLTNQHEQVVEAYEQFLVSNGQTGLREA
eukprot:NODE_241_length_2406_cov_35.750530_g188_i0.p1 GENE.NODE_241_length_2406_cov_35.750530_g188_i0~~NODE_241_length_2406_cov_35.750530_g188_i0.p1  ORF type:complete len:373 (+),score=191.40 NODE_241_length_2406_cov_35.750530_g188_i0:105-1121(+)